VYILPEMCVCACVDRQNIDKFNMSLSGTKRYDYDERRHERALVLMDTAAGCTQEISQADPCFQGDLGSTETVTCMGHVLTNDDKCWFHGMQAYKEKKYGRARGKYAFIKDTHLISLVGLEKFVQEALMENNVRFLGQAVPADLLVAMGKEIKTRKAARAIQLQQGVVVGLEQISSPFLHAGVLFLL
jgi:hypothetical protein